MLFERRGQIDDMIIQFGNLARLIFDRVAHFSDFLAKFMDFARLIGECLRIVLNDPGDSSVGDGLHAWLGFPSRRHCTRHRTYGGGKCGDDQGVRKGFQDLGTSHELSRELHGDGDPVADCVTLDQRDQGLFAFGVRCRDNRAVRIDRDNVEAGYAVEEVDYQFKRGTAQHDVVELHGL